MASFTSLPRELKSKIIADVVISTTEAMAKDVVPISLNHISNMTVLCVETLLPLASVSGTFITELIHTCWIHGYTSPVPESAHSEDQTFMLQFMHHYYATVMCDAYDMEEKPRPEYWNYHRNYGGEVEAAAEKARAAERAAAAENEDILEDPWWP